MNRNLASGRTRSALHGQITRYWQEIASVAGQIDVAEITRAASMLLECQANDRLIFVAGNGGSAATASHLACDLVKGTRNGGPPTFRVVALTDNVPLMTAWANDADYAQVFAEQLRSLARPSDLLVAISASGTSPNIVAAVDWAARLGLVTIAVSGRTGGRIGELADHTIHVPSDRIEVVEDAHLIVAHSLCVATRERLAATTDRLLVRAAMLPTEPVDLTA